MATEQDNEKVKSVAVLLAAGSSSRMGQSKQLLKFGGETLIRKTTRVVIDSGVDKVVVVLGSNQEIHRREIADLPIEIITNSNWEKGMGSSIKSGVQFVDDHFQKCQSILFTVCDQPLLASDHLKKMIRSFQIEKSAIVASFYSGLPGVPALFDRSMFEELLVIDDRHGAKKIVQDHIKSARLIHFSEGEVDLDTPGDWEKFSQSH